MSTLFRRPRLAVVVTAAVAALALTGAGVGAASAAPSLLWPTPDRSSATTTPIKHLVVIFDENVSFAHYFATYPNAANTDGTTFTAAAGTPQADTLQNAHLLTGNPNLYQPQRLT